MKDISIEEVVSKVDKNLLTISELDTSLDEVYRNGEPFVSIEQFLDDDYYLGRVGKSLYPENRPDLLDIFHPLNNYLEVVFAGATSIGKTFMTCIALAYMIGQLGHYINPHKRLGSSEVTPIVFINMSITAKKAEEIVYAGVKGMIDSSPYFQEHFQRDKRLRTSLVWWLKYLGQSQTSDLTRSGPSIQFHPGTGEYLSGLGENVFGGAIDEANFFRVIEKSVKSRGEKYDPAQKLYDTVTRRLKGRFSVDGQSLGKMFLLSSAQYPDDFIERRIDEAREDGSLGITVKVIRKSLWQAKKGVFISGKSVFSGRTFRVEVGTTRRNSRLLDTYNKKTGEVIKKEYDNLEGKIIKPPIELWDDFHRDIDGAIRDFGGEVTRAIIPYFPDIQMLYEAEQDDLQHPYSAPNTTLRDGVQFLQDVLFKKEKNTGRWLPKRHPKKARYFHVDTALSGDSLGLSVVHISGWATIMLPGGEREDRPVFETDLMLEVVPPRGGEIQFADIEGIFLMLRRFGMYFRFGSFDLKIMSAASMQRLAAQGFAVDKLSVDTDLTPYQVLKDAYYDRRMRTYLYNIVTDELFKLEKRKEKIDHPPGGKKDVSDGLAGAVYNAFRHEFKASPDQLASRRPVTVHRPENVQQRMRRDKKQMEKDMIASVIREVREEDD